MFGWLRDSCRFWSSRAAYGSSRTPSRERCQTLPDALAVLSESLPPPLPGCESTTDGWLQWPVGHFIADHGVAHFDASMSTMLELTQRFTAEFETTHGRSQPLLVDYVIHTVRRREHIGESL